MDNHRIPVPHRLTGIRIQPASTATHCWLENSCEKTEVAENRLGMIVTRWTKKLGTDRTLSYMLREM